MRSRERHWTKRSSCSALGNLVLFFVAVFFFASRLEVGAAAGPTASFTRALDAYFNEQPYRTIVLLHESMARPDTAPLREASLYLLAQSFASIHLYEKAEDSLSALLNEFPNGRFAPIALRELARIFFNLHEYAAVVNLEQSFRGRVSEGTFPVEFWYLLGESNYLVGRKQQARDPLLRVVAGNSFFPFARYTLAQVEFALGHPESALGALAEITSGPNTPQLLKDRAIRVAGMILYQQKRYTDAMHTYQSISQSSTLFGPTRIDLALAADAAGDEQTAERAFADAMEHGDDDLIRTEARVAVGRFLNKRQKAAAARTLFEQALGDLKTREARLREAVEVDAQFRETFAELVTFARQSGGNPRRERLAEDLALMRSTLSSTMGVNYDRANIPAFEKLSPKTYLFPLLQQHFHNPAIIETFVELEVEVEDLRKQVDRLANDIRAQAAVWSGNPPIKAGAVPEDIKNSISEMQWLVFGNYDLQTRFFDALAVNEKVDQGTVVREKQRALGETLDALRLILFGGRRVPSQESMLALLEAARVKIESGKLPGMLATKVREGFLQEWKADRDSLTYVVENLNLKERQMNNALTGVPLRSRNVNLPVLSTMSDWLTALQQLVYKYQFIDVPRDERPWHLAGLNSDVSMILAEATRDLQTLQERSVAVLRDVARDLVSKQQFRHALIAAQAEEGIADALFQERAGR